MEAGRGCLSSSSEPLVHWERLINKRTRIQIRKAQSRGCRGNLQQAPSLSGVGTGTCQARLPPPPSPPPRALPSSAWTQQRSKATERQAWAPTASYSQVTPLPKGAYIQGPPECNEPSPASFYHPGPSTKHSSASLHVVMPSGFCQASGLEAITSAQGRGGRVR